MTTVITYGTFDLFHIGHLKLLQRLADLGDRLVVGVSSDEFNKIKGKNVIVPYAQRAEIVSSIRYVDEVFPEDDWAQKRSDIARFGADVLGMGHDWEGKFDDLSDVVRVEYLPRTDGVSTTEMKRVLSAFDEVHVAELKRTLDSLSEIVKQLS
ncbi:adenylyltransferase/cytidyltransferase family protein [Auraticoccus monumenti]|uniref:Glycerol-3-phosphate cytidylyltransferase n=1 Tax=Auraticoccus monumenti TaxID=675864 RepID=A0A1G7C7B5_9ACTN|nr:Glycerol-3-phosphate cytidylyltransferase [Auraticoccus monumenti]